VLIGLPYQHSVPPGKQDLRGDEPARTSSGNENGAPSTQRPHSAQQMADDGCGLHEGSCEGVDAFGENEHLRGGRMHARSEAAVYVDAEQTQRAALVVRPRLAPLAAPTGQERLHSHEVPGADVTNALAHLDHLAGELVAQDHWRRGAG